MNLPINRHKCLIALANDIIDRSLDMEKHIRTNTGLFALQEHGSTVCG